MQIYHRASDLFTEAQRKVLLALGDAIIPHLEGEEAAYVLSHLPTDASDRQRELAVDFARTGFADRPEMLDNFTYQATHSLSPTSLGQINLLLHTLSYAAGCLLLTGHIGPFDTLDRPTRERILMAWLSSPIPLLRKGASGLRGLYLLSWYRFCQPAWEATGYPAGPATDWQQAEADKEAAEAYPYVFENDSLLPGEGPVELYTDILVVGSGSGGGVAAAHLSKRGLNVLVVDKGSYIHPGDYSGREDKGYMDMYECGGVLPTEDGSVTVLAGSTFGGGSTINWSASLKPRDIARRAWSEKYGVKYYASPAFTYDLNYVCHRMGASTAPIQHNKANSLLAIGAQRLGHAVDPVPQNSGGHVHYCGKCQFGCIAGQKQGGPVTWLRDTAENGGKFLVKCDIRQVLFDDKANPRKATGAVGFLTDSRRKVVIRATKAVIVASGSINTPAVLLRTPTLKYNKRIGKGLSLHPVTCVTGYYDFPINPWEGGLLTMVDNACEFIDPTGWGCKIEVIASSPSIHSPYVAYDNPVNHKARMLKYPHSFTLIVLVRDRDGGEVVIDGNGDARLNYSVSKHDRASMLAGVLRSTEIHLMAGASEIATAQIGVPTFHTRSAPRSTGSLNAQTNGIAPKTAVIPGLDDINAANSLPTLSETIKIPGVTVPEASIPGDPTSPAFVAWQNKIKSVGLGIYTATVGSAHQMASCRMSSHPRLGALDSEGRVWGAKNLWVADASCLPEASGVNPMVTTMATAQYVARNVGREVGAPKPEFGFGGSAGRIAQL
ncbi:unnamed protein product [Tilletia controversa]|uniref:Long-chain-alcohol oxidase n=3 Tax=Tilletia TaxID=13289 RepID=A0A8X7MQP2_9BASI|nr:hypothetical protein CF336_g3609 [Tilletia laevis]KAE8199247.1 hypothetical protein CF328_g3301 [Tilletia controversa]KAE8261835.1 hypothetical protein A4X03_0g2926 [Tilletia caries]KAE8203941.1 hypothetical protein CF335_g2837 [Tilletia laevis]KAE8245906.1 hypothetical protein A4X06_0g5335 [Tilletia controversa]